jgi:hypothetical protein
MNRSLYAAFAAAVIALSQSMPSSAQTGAQTPQKREPIYGYRMMTDQERNEYREKMRDAGSAQERQALRDEHRKLMQDRMAEQGVQGDAGGGRGRGMGPHGPGTGEVSGPRGGTGMGGPGGPGMRGPRGNRPSTTPGAPATPPAAPAK